MREVRSSEGGVMEGLVFGGPSAASEMAEVMDTADDDCRQFAAAQAAASGAEAVRATAAGRSEGI